MPTPLRRAIFLFAFGGSLLATGEERAWDWIPCIRAIQQYADMWILPTPFDAGVFGGNVE